MTPALRLIPPAEVRGGDRSRDFVDPDELPVVVLAPTHVVQSVVGQEAVDRADHNVVGPVGLQSARKLDELSPPDAAVHLDPPVAGTGDLVCDGSGQEHRTISIDEDPPLLLEVPMSTPSVQTRVIRASLRPLAETSSFSCCDVQRGMIEFPAAGGH